MSLPGQVTVVEVGPRDGLQNEPDTVPTALKVALIERLAATGLRVVEATAFVRPDRVPQLADAGQVMDRLTRRPGVRYPVLVPNETGLERALAHGVTEIAVLTAASEAFSRRNLGRGVGASLEMLRPVVEQARDAGLGVRAYVSTALGCPYQGSVPVEDVVTLTTSLADLGVGEISLGDTIGVGTPGQVRTLLGAVTAEVPVDRLAVHMHDTYGQGLANTLAALEGGVAVADTSVGGLGGCPFAPGAAGNLATEDLVYALHGSGVDTGVDLAALVDTTAWLASELGRDPASRAARAILARRGASDGD